MFKVELFDIPAKAASLFELGGATRSQIVVERNTIVSKSRIPTMTLRQQLVLVRRDIAT